MLLPLLPLIIFVVQGNLLSSSTLVELPDNVLIVFSVNSIDLLDVAAAIILAIFVDLGILVDPLNAHTLLSIGLFDILSLPL